MTLDTAFMFDHLPDFGHAALVTLAVAGIAIAASLLVAALNSAVIFFRMRGLSWLVRAYVELARNTPLLIQLFFIYFALPSLGVHLSNYATAVLALTFLGGGYFTEVFRAGIEAVPRSQTESGLALGLSRWQLFRMIVLPQALRIATPSLFANFIFLLKETTVVSAVAIPEILYTTTNYIALYYKTYEMLLLMTFLYLLLFLPLSFLLSWLERRFRHGQFGI
ncbi:amino acid ABC transporter permease [Paenibacillus elgii]|uniref:amino acid ABC transporter permease n=1 Tax=Paenibacillus elgii TaxID=189691 RepID=UPI000248CC37|nr:amino acid ABC transporter permease [Paenibacillus elgii]